MPRSSTDLNRALEALQQRCSEATVADKAELLERGLMLGDEIRGAIAAYVAPGPLEIARASTKDIYCGSPITDGAVVLWDRGRFRYMPAIVIKVGQFRATLHVVDEVCDGLYALDFAGHAQRMAALMGAFERVLRSPEVRGHERVVARNPRSH